MLETHDLDVDRIYVPVKMRKTLDQGKLETIAESIMEGGAQIPVKVRPGKDRFVLVKGLHRLEAARALGEETIAALIISRRGV